MLAQPDKTERRFIWTFGGIGLVLLLVAGGLTIPAVHSYRQTKAELSSYVLATAPILEDSKSGRRVMIEGTIAPETPPVHGTFVAYWAGHVTGSSDDDSTVMTETAAPNLILVTPQGRIRLHGPYAIDNPPHTLAGNDIDSYHGFVAGDPVFVLGIASGNGDGAELNAQVVSGESRGSYMFQTKISSLIGFLPVGICGMIGLIFGGVALALWRFRQPTRFHQINELTL